MLNVFRSFHSFICSFSSHLVAHSLSRQFRAMHNTHFVCVRLHVSIISSWNDVRGRNCERRTVLVSFRSACVSSPLSTSPLSHQSLSISFWPTPLSARSLAHLNTQHIAVQSEKSFYARHKHTRALRSHATVIFEIYIKLIRLDARAAYSIKYNRSWWQKLVRVRFKRFYYHFDAHWLFKRKRVIWMIPD